MTTNAAEGFNAAISDILRNAQTKNSEPEKAPRRPAASAEAAPARLPHHVAGGFAGVGDDLGTHAREWRSMARALDKQRRQFEAADTESVASFGNLSKLVPQVEEAGKSLKAMLDAARSGDLSGDLSAEFDRTLSRLAEMESLAESLSSDIEWLRASWEHYARAALKAQTMREEMRAEAAAR